MCQFIQALPDTDGEPGQVGSTERGGVCSGVVQHGLTQNIGLKLHERIVPARSAIREQGAQFNTCLGLHHIKHIPYLVRNCLNRRARHVRGGGATCQSGYQAARRIVPVRRAQARQGGNQVEPIGLAARTNDVFWYNSRASRVRVSGCAMPCKRCFHNLTMEKSNE